MTRNDITDAPIDLQPLTRADVINGGVTPQTAVERAFRRVEEIFAKYQLRRANPDFSCRL